jgi:hypothetical protein
LAFEKGGDLEELDVVVVADGRLVLRPYGIYGVDARAVKVDGEVDEVAVLEQHALHLLLLRERLAVLPQHHAHAGARSSVSSLLDAVRAAAVAAPQVARARIAAARHHAHAVARHEHTVESDAELADEGGGGVA